MSDTPTPGEVAYTAYCAVLDSHWRKPAWAGLLPEVQRLWEDAAQAAIAAWWRAHAQGSCGEARRDA